MQNEKAFKLKAIIPSPEKVKEDSRASRRHDTARTAILHVTHSHDSLSRFVWVAEPTP